MCFRYCSLLLTWAGLTVSSFAEAATEEVYKVDWKDEKSAGSEWTTEGKLMTSPNQLRRFLGAITDKSATSLKLDNLPEHEVLTIEVELFLVGTWDGSNQRWGNDTMTVTLDDKRVLMNTTFSNCMSNNWSGSQHYPKDMIGSGNYNCFTGISQIGELGYRQSWARYEPVQTVPIDSTYKLKFSVPHTAEAFAINFQSKLNEQDGGADDQEKQWYGIGNVAVTVSNAQIVDEKEWNKLRCNLFNSFIPISNHAFWEMMRYPKRFSSDLNLLKQSSSQQRWWFERAERLLAEDVKVGE